MAALIANLFLTLFPGSGAGVVVSPVVVGAARKLELKAKRQKYTFENGITVWATDERMARIFAVGETTPEEPRTAATVATAIPGERAAVADAPAKIDLRAIHARLLAERNRAEEEIVMRLMMEAPAAAASVDEAIVQLLMEDA